MNDQIAAVHHVAAHNHALEHRENLVVVFLVVFVIYIAGERRVRLIIVDAVLLRGFLPRQEALGAFLVGAGQEDFGNLSVVQVASADEMVDIRVNRVETGFLYQSIGRVYAQSLLGAAGLNRNFHHKSASIPFVNLFAQPYYNASTPDLQAGSAKTRRNRRDSGAFLPYRSRVYLPATEIMPTSSAGLPIVVEPG